MKSITGFLFVIIGWALMKSQDSRAAELERRKKISRYFTELIVWHLMAYGRGGGRRSQN